VRAFTGTGGRWTFHATGERLAPTAGRMTGVNQRHINAYLGEIDRLRKFGGRGNEQVIRSAFQDLLRQWSKDAGLVFIPELPFETARKTKVYPDGTILHDVRVPLGYWEAKDTADDLDTEIAKKFRNGYPQDNILFENSDSAVLIQNGAEVMRCSMTDTDALGRLLTLFFGYERKEIADFRRAVQQFKTDLPAVLAALRDKIDGAYAGNPAFQTQAAEFLEHAKQTINPTLGRDDVREMLIQHILTEEIFARVFEEGDFHRQNNVARLLYALEQTFFRGEEKKATMRALQPYYAAIYANAAQISSHTEKQAFLKVIYENFYKVYNPDAADRLGVVYTPNEIVRFMIEGADWLCDERFGKRLIDRDVEILDPATGTGTYVCELIEFFRGQPDKLRHKYTEELHANEVAILPYYVANLNIEATYQAVSGQYAEYPNLCFVDTLDNVAGLGIKAGHQMDLFAAISDENVERVRRQNKRKISVIIGNPPYNANQQNENDNNKNRAYPHIDGLIKRSFVKLSTAQKTKVYDMYARFFRWASDRLHDDGILAFVTNRSFIDSRTFDGFRRYVQETFAEVYVIDLGGDVRANPKLSGTKHNVFGIQTGVAISFMVRRKRRTECRIFYARRPEFETAEEKLSWLASEKLSDVKMERIEPDKRATWINHTKNTMDDFIHVADKKTKTAPARGQDRAVFKLYSLGVVTARDEWVVNVSESAIARNVKETVAQYSRSLGRDREPWNTGGPHALKWTRALKARFERGEPLNYESRHVVKAAYRPFCSRLIYFAPELNEMQYQLQRIFPLGIEAQSINVSGFPAAKPFQVLAVKQVPSYDQLEKTTCFPRYRHTKSGDRLDNITDWALNKFNDHYGKATKITKDDIFAYVYAVLHDPVYRETYALNLRREFPRIPFYPDFRKWRDWGQTLLDLHIGYETVAPWPLVRSDVPDPKSRDAGLAPKPVLKAERDLGRIRLDSETTLSGIPPEVWDYRLGNRSALDWILDQYKEKTPKDPTIRERFNTYRFADYKEQVIDLLARVTRVSVETVAITRAMAALPRPE
jgi:predicted helicase